VLDLAAGLLRRHVGRRPQHRPRLRPRAARRRRGETGHRRAVGPGRLGQPPVHDLDLAELAHHDVGRLQVAVDDAARVGERHRLTDLLEDGQEARQVGRGAGPLPEELGEGAALHQLHGEEGPAVVQPADLDDGHDAGVLQPAGDLRLLQEAALQVGAPTKLLAQHLDGQVAAQVGVGGAVDGAHAAAADLLVQLTPPGVGRPAGRASRSGPAAAVSGGDVDGVGRGSIALTLVRGSGVVIRRTR
jgi:hypothetical protein